MTTSLKHSPNRRAVLKSMAALSGGALAGTFVGIRPVLGQQPFEVTMQLGWLASNGLIGDIVADHLGYFAEEGLSLRIVPGGPNIDGVASVASGAANLGQLSSSPSLMLARSQGLPVKCIAAGYQQHPFTYFSLAGNPVREPRDLIGKNVGTNGTAQILLRALLARNGIPEDEVQVTIIGSDMTPLMTGQVDVVTGWKTNTQALAILGDQRVELTLWDGGVQLYANPYYVTDATLADHRPQVESMVRASARGWGWVHDNPEEAVRIMVERYPNMDLQVELDTIAMVLAYSFNDRTAQGGWGTMTAENWQAQLDIYDELGQFEAGKPALDDVMTLSILEATAADRPTYG